MTSGPRCILIVDDSPEDRDLYKRLLLSQNSEWQYRFLEAELGEEGLALCRAEQLDCILLDYRLPDLDGLEFLNALAVEHGMLSIPVIMLTGQGDRAVDLEAMRVGAVDYLVKAQVNATLLERAVRYAVERGRADAALRASETRFRSLAVSSPIGIFLTDVTGAWVYTNPRWQDISGQAPEESLGWGWIQAIAPEEREAVAAEWQACLPEGHEFSREFRLIQSAEEVRWVHARAAAMRSATGMLLGYVGTIEDITARRLVERMKDEFVSAVSHELRTPLTSLRLALELLASQKLGELSENGQYTLGIARTSADRLMRLVNDILDIERLESGKVPLRKQSCDAAELLIQAADVMQAMADKAGVTLSVRPQTMQLWADSDRIIQTLANLLSNAIKVSPPGASVWLTVERQGDQVVFQVRDQGHGIPADKLESIFDRFQQLDTSDSQKKEGSGLGLERELCAVDPHILHCDTGASELLRTLFREPVQNVRAGEQLGE